MKAIIAGGGVGGLATAIGLGQLGWDVQVFERALAFSDAGAGLQISANGMHVLHQLGVATQIASYQFEPTHLELHMGQSGRRIFALPIKDVSCQRWGAPYVHIKRSDLIGAMLTRLKGLPNVSITMGVAIEGYCHEKGLCANASDGQTYTADILVGADGIKSQVRHHMLGADAPRFTGNVAWRAMVPVAALGVLAPPPTACVWAGSKRHAVTTRVAAGEMINFVGIVEQDSWREEGWTLQGNLEDALSDFEGWHPTILNILKNAPVLNKWAIYDRPPLDQWSDGDVVLLGDAAHPMVPSMAQGATQALEDAACLAQKLERSPHIPAALADFYQTRRRRTAKVQSLSMRNLQRFHIHGPLEKLATFAPMWLAGKIAPRLALRQFDWLYGYKGEGVLEPLSEA